MNKYLDGKALSKMTYNFPIGKSIVFDRATQVRLTTTSIYFVHLWCMVCKSNVGIHHNFYSGDTKCPFELLIATTCMCVLTNTPVSKQHFI